MREKSQLVYLAGIVVFLLCLVRFFQSIANDFTKEFVINQDEHQMNSIEKWFHPSGYCITVGYGIIVIEM
jgi:hypothetical protein